MLQNKSIKRLYGILAGLTLLVTGACSDDNGPVIVEDTPLELLRGSWTMTSAGYGLSAAPTGTNTVNFGTTSNVTMTCSDSGSTPYSSASGTYSVSGDNILKVQWSMMNIEGESDNAFNGFYMTGKMTISGTSMQWDYSIYDSSTSAELAGPFTARFTKNTN